MTKGNTLEIIMQLWGTLIKGVSAKKKKELFIKKREGE